jgi:4-amino-4-deoxy-L-arabinose transferase-like glycosyltransferase
VATGVLYTYDLSINGIANTYYSAAVYSGSHSWRAFLFGSLDPANSVTVDKPPAALWLQELAVRAFGFSSWSLLVPEALAGVATVLTLYALVQRWLGDGAAVLAALALALTPVAVLMFRYNSPDALLTLLLVAAAWALWRALESGRTAALVLSGALVGLAFTTKLAQALIVVPAFVLTYLWCGPFDLRRRVVQSLWAGLALVVSGGWWVGVVQLWPTASRPYIGGSTDNSVLQLIVGYDGLGRLAGGQPVTGAAGDGGTPALWRMFDVVVGGQVAWLLPLALVGLAAGLWWRRSGPRADRRRAGFVLWGAWTLCTGVVFSTAHGTFHAYYTVALAPGVAALAAGGAAALWQLGQGSTRWAPVLPAMVVVSAIWAAVLIDRRSAGGAAARLIVVAGVLGAGLVVARLSGRAPVGPAAVVATTIALLVGPGVFSLDTVRQSTAALYTPLAGPTGGGGSGRLESVGTAATGPGGLVPSRLDLYLEGHRRGATYLAAVTSAQVADGMILATGYPVLAMGGFLGTDPWPTVSAFRADVAAGRVRYALLGGGGFSDDGPAGTEVAAIDRWVRDHGTVVPGAAIGGWAGGTLYELTRVPVHVVTGRRAVAAGPTPGQNGSVGEHEEGHRGTD